MIGARSIAVAFAAMSLAAACESAPEPTPAAAPTTGPAPAKAAAPAAIAWETDEATAFARARAERKAVMIDFRSEWCEPCLEYEARTFTAPAVAALVGERYVALRLDVTNFGPAEEALMQRYKVETLPTVMFVAPAGAELARTDDFLAPEPFVAFATSAAARATSVESRSADRAAPPPGR